MVVYNSFNLSQAVLITGSWPLSLATFLIDLLLAWLLLYTPRFIRGGTLKGTVVWPLGMALIVRIVDASFEFCTASPAQWFSDNEQYFQMLYTLMWDLGLVFLVFDFVASAGLILQLRERKRSIYVWATLVQYGWLAATVLVIVAGQAMQGANITRSMSWTDDIQDTTSIMLIDTTAIHGFIRAYYLMCTAGVAVLVPINLAILALPYVDSGSHSWVKVTIAPTGTLQALGFTLFCLPLLVLTLIYSNARLWSQVAPSDIVQFGVSQVLPQALITVYLTMVKFLVSRWDWWRAEDISEAKEILRTFWEGEFLEALCFARQQRAERRSAAAATGAGAMVGRGSDGSHTWNNNNGRGSRIGRSTRTVPVPWILAQASSRLASPSNYTDHDIHSSCLYSTDLVDALKLLHRVAQCVSDAVILEAPSSGRTLRTLWRRSDNKCVDLKSTEAKAADFLLESFTPMTRAAAERLAMEWTKVFAMDRTGGRVWLGAGQ